jgi:hypothetical protein
MKIRKLKKKFRVLMYLYFDHASVYQIKYCAQCKFKARGKYQVKSLIVHV